MEVREIGGREAPHDTINHFSNPISIVVVVEVHVEHILTTLHLLCLPLQRKREPVFAGDPGPVGGFGEGLLASAVRAVGIAILVFVFVFVFVLVLVLIPLFVGTFFVGIAVPRWATVRYPFCLELIRGC